MKKKFILHNGDLKTLGLGDKEGVFKSEIREHKCTKDEYSTVSYLQLYSYATLSDKLFTLLGVILTLVVATVQSIFNIAFGDVIQVIIIYVTDANDSSIADEARTDALMSGLNRFTITTTAVGILTFSFTYLATVLVNYSALRQIHKIRSLYLEKVLNQDIAWYDINQTGDFASRVSDDLKRIEEGINDKITMVVLFEGVFLVNLIISFIKGWELTLVCLISFPVNTIVLGAISWITSKLSTKEMDAYGEAGAIAEEVFGAVKTVTAFGGQNKEIERYHENLKLARDNNVKRSCFNAMSNGLLWLLTYGSCSLAFWYGVRLILEQKNLPPSEQVYSAGNFITIFFGVLGAVWSFGMASPYIEIFGVAQGAAAKIFGVIKSSAVINSSKGNGFKPDKIKGNVTFNNVFFNYPSRPDVQVLQGLDLRINHGERVALVGSSGCGKSTCIQLVQRFYDPEYGSVYLDENKLSELDLTWLRSHIGVVAQEPVLFEATIAENIKYGLQSATQEDIEKAAKRANAHSFITSLPLGYRTFVGERGALLSGGQKQRIAIARALIRQPVILLLDEATSALDTSSESIVQTALDEVSKGCTTIIVAHRLSTVRKADRIIVISNGRVVEQGTHEVLMKKKNAYYDLVTSQVSSEEDTLAMLSDQQTDKLQEKEITKSIDYKKMSMLTDESIVVAETEESAPTSLWAIMKLNAPEWWLIIVGCLASVLTGASLPVYSILFGDVLGVLSSSNEDYVRHEINNKSFYLLLLGIIIGIATFIQVYAFGIAGENLTMRLRNNMFIAMLRQEMGWYDDKENGSGSLCARLSGEAASVQGATGQRISTIINSVSTILLSTGFAMYFEWRLGLVALCFSPLIIVAIYFEQKLGQVENVSQYKVVEKSTKVAVEAISNIRTVASLGCEKHFHVRYIEAFIPYLTVSKKNAHVKGILFGTARSVMFFSYCAAIYYGAMLVRDTSLSYDKVFKVTELLITGAWSIGNAMAFTPNFQKGLAAASRIFKLLNRTPHILNKDDSFKELWEKGDIKYSKINFSYSTRPREKVLKDLDLSVLQGQSVALVGPSGCGKSTIIQLLLRYYDPISGKIKVDESDIKTTDLAILRSQLGIVSQEPNLFSRTIAENIAYGDNEREISGDEIIQAAKNANIHNFICSLPLGYDTKLGEKGTQLSGGQKQRVAIARALVRNPRVLLLDEATSALDTESEKVVQEALENAKKGRTCITIAHRLSTIQDADVIFVINHGQIAEMGTHSQLINQRGLYFKLNNLQIGHT